MKPVVALSIPTGIGAQIGGYAGDFGYIAREFSKNFYCIVNPNAVNGGILSAINYNMAYLEGYLFDAFFKGDIGIVPKKPYEANKIGVIFDVDIKEDILNVHYNTLNALKMVQGVDIVGIELTDHPVGVEIVIQNGISSGNLVNPYTIINAADKLIKKGAEAIAIVCNFKDDQEDELYSSGVGIDPIGGIEAIISHLVTKEFNIPAAHAPAFYEIDISKKLENPKVASEMISSTYLPCIIQGLSIAPKISKFNNGEIVNKNVEYLIVPNGALGSSAVLGAYKNNIKIIAVNNPSAIDVSADKLNIKLYKEYNNYQDCISDLM